MVAGSTSEIETIESHRFVFWCMGRWLAALRRPGAHQRYADTWLTANAAPYGRYWHKADITVTMTNVRYRGEQRTSQGLGTS
jgi:hypothetical protein